MQADILLITVTDAETRAVFTALTAQTGHSPDRKFLGDKTYYDLGRIGGVRVWLVRSEQGTAVLGGALFTVLTALGEMRPAAVILVGVAFGTNPRRQRLGDVLVATQIQLYEPQHVGSDEAGMLQIAPRGDKATVSPRLLDRCRDGALFWPEERAQVLFGLLLSGEKLIEHPATLARLLNREPEAVGAEMEGAGLYVAATTRKVDWIVIRSIGAWPDDSRTPDRTQDHALAARSAAEFTLHVLAQGGLAPPSDQAEEAPPAARPPGGVTPTLSEEARAALARLRDPAQPLGARLAASAKLVSLGSPHLLSPYTGEALAGSYWCDVEPGPFWFGDARSDGAEQLQQVVQIHPYRIARFPVTNTEYRRFIEAGGYAPEKPWWNTLVRMELQSDLLAGPRWWNDASYNDPAQPVVGVSWYEAAAYCVWLTIEGQAQGWLPPDMLIRLPTWREWQRAARHTDQRRYPWGQAAPDPERANYDQTNIGKPSPVGCFPAGKAACGALDMAGNVQEWTATPQHQPQQIEPITDPKAEAWMIVAGGAFHSGSDRLGCGFRTAFDPSARVFNQGFRVVWSLRSQSAVRQLFGTV